MNRLDRPQSGLKGTAPLLRRRDRMDDDSVPIFQLRGMAVDGYWPEWEPGIAARRAASKAL